MNKISKMFIVVLILLGISIILFITGKRYDVFIENNTTTSIKYSINGEPYQILDAKKKTKVFSKGLSNII